MKHDDRILKSGLVEEDRPGFFDLPRATSCPDQRHDPPRALAVPAGQGYRHVCPTCGATEVVYGDRGAMGCRP